MHWMNYLQSMVDLKTSSIFSWMVDAKPPMLKYARRMTQFCNNCERSMYMHECILHCAKTLGHYFVVLAVRRHLKE